MPNRLQKINRVSCEPLYRLGKDNVDFPCIRILYHLSELITLGRAGAGNSIIRIYSGIFPIRVPLD